MPKAQGASGGLMPTAATRGQSRITFPLRMPADVDQAVRARAEAEDRSMNNLIVRLLRAALETPEQEQRAS